jgi:hypothetical protein
VVGATIIWTNTGAVAHTATADDGASFDSGNLDPHATFSFTPDTRGTFPYHCTFHPLMARTENRSAGVPNQSWAERCARRSGGALLTGPTRSIPTLDPGRNLMDDFAPDATAILASPRAGGA